MFMLRIILILIGLLFMGFGYSIWFNSNYDLINNFKNDKKIGKLDDSYAERVGMIEFIGGVLCLVLGIVGMFLEDTFTIGFFAFCLMSIIAALIFNQMKSAKKTKQD